MQAQENGVALDEEQLLFLVGGQDKAIDEDMDEQPVQDLALNEQVELYERRARFELTEREQKIDEQLRIVISDRNFKEETLKKELHSVKLQLASMDNLIENLTNTLAILTQPYKTFLPQTNNQLRTSSNTRNHAIVQDGRVVVHNVQGRLNRGQGNNPQGGSAAGYEGAHNRVGNSNP
nr:integrase, catalytic region, zinc finger, CCHC-type, peptidase aspartic, catalytic [Tanacetum cinerariifolium]